MKIALVDDDPKDMENLISHLRKYEKEMNLDFQLTTYSDGAAFLNSYNYQYDFVIFDIDMPGINGIETAKRLRAHDTRVVVMFVTNMPQYALDGFAVDAVDYLLKPLSYPDFRLKMQKALRYIEVSHDYTLSISTNSGIVRLSSSEIYYVESQLHYVTYHTKNGDYRARASLRDIEPQLKDLHFSRCGNSYLVNLAFVDSIANGEVFVNGTSLPLSRGKKSSFMNDFSRYIGGIS